MTTAGSVTADDVWPPGSGGCPHPPAVRDAILQLGRAISFDEVRRRGFGHLASWYGPYAVAEEIVMERAHAAKDLQARAVAELRQRVTDIEHVLFDGRGGLGGDLVETLAQVVAQTNKRLTTEFDNKLAAMDARFARVESSQLRFLGVHEPGRQYAPGNLVVRGGGLWHCNSDTRDVPGRSSCWQLAVKSGELRKETTG